MSADAPFLAGADFAFNSNPAYNEDIYMDFLKSAPSNDFLNATGPANTNNPLNNTINPANTALNVDFGQHLNCLPPGLPTYSSSSSSSLLTGPSMSASNYSSNTCAMSLEAASPSDPKDRMTTRSQVRETARSGLSLHDSIDSSESMEDTANPSVSEDEADESSPPPPPKKKRGARGGAKQAKTERRKSLGRNRLAASKCRQKKNEWMHDLEYSKATLEKQHNELLSGYAGLFEEITQLKNSLVTHAECNDPNIDGWINNEAAKYAQRVRNSKDTNASSDDRHDSVSLRTPTDVDYGGLAIPMDQVHKGNGAVNDLDHDYMDEAMFNEDIFMTQPQEVI